MTNENGSLFRQVDGYAKDEVDRYVSILTEAYQKAFDEYNSLSDKYDDLLEQYNTLSLRQERRSGYRDVTEQSAGAEVFAQPVIADAQAETDRINADAVKIAQMMLDEADAEANRPERRSHKLIGRIRRKKTKTCAGDCVGDCNCDGECDCADECARTGSCARAAKARASARQEPIQQAPIQQEPIQQEPAQRDELSTQTIDMLQDILSQSLAKIRALKDTEA